MRMQTFTCLLVMSQALLQVLTYTAGQAPHQSLAPNPDTLLAAPDLHAA
jgi:hypothetical protein